MTQMSGNPHYAEAEEFLEDAYFHEGEYSGLRETQIALQRAQIQSNLAVAYELRTANIAATSRLNLQMLQAGITASDQLVQTINPRLGIDEEGNPTE